MRPAISITIPVVVAGQDLDDAPMPVCLGLEGGGFCGKPSYFGGFDPNGRWYCARHIVAALQMEAVKQSLEKENTNA